MKRRSFLKSLTALIAAPVLPAKAVFAAPTASAAMPPPNLYTWSTTIARVQGKISTETLMLTLKVDSAQARTIFDRLLINDVIGPADALGVAKAKSILPPQVGLDARTLEKTISPPNDKTELNHPDLPEDPEVDTERDESEPEEISGR